MQKVQYCERSSLESQRPGTVLHSLFAELLCLIAGMYLWISSGSISDVSLIIFSSGWGSEDDQELEHLTWRGWGRWAGTAWGEGTSGSRVSSPPAPTRRLSTLRARLFTTSSSWEDERREIQAGYQESLFHHDDGQAVEQVVHRTCAFSVLGGFQETTKAMNNLFWPQTWPCFEQELGLETSWRPFQLGLCSYSVIHLGISSLSFVVLSPFCRDLEDKRHSLIRCKM